MREIAPFGLRMPPELKARIEAEARANGRSINTEVISRLQDSLRDQSSKRVAMEPSSPGYHDNGLSTTDKEMLAVFRALPASKQLALLSLFK